MTRWRSDYLPRSIIKLKARVLLLSLAVALTGCGLSTSRPQSATATPSVNSEVQSGPATPIAGPYGAVQRDAKLKFTAARYAGVALVDNALNIYISGIDKSDPATFEGYPVKHVRYSLVELETAQNRISSVAEQLNSSGHTLFQWGVDVATNSVMIIVRDPRTDSVAAIMLLGSGPYRFVAGIQPSVT